MFARLSPARNPINVHSRIAILALVCVCVYIVLLLTHTCKIYDCWRIAIALLALDQHTHTNRHTKNTYCVIFSREDRWLRFVATIISIRKLCICTAQMIVLQRTSANAECSVIVAQWYWFTAFGCGRKESRFECAGNARKARKLITREFARTTCSWSYCVRSSSKWFIWHASHCKTNATFCFLLGIR